MFYIDPAASEVYNEPLKALIVDVFIDKHVSVIERFIFRASSSQTFDDIFQSVLNEFYDSHPETKELHDEKIKESSSVLVYVSSCNNKLDRCSITRNQTLKLALEVVNVKFVDFYVQSNVTTADTPSTSKCDITTLVNDKKRNAMSLLLSTTPRKIKRIEPKTRHHTLFNDLLDLVQEEDGILQPATHEKEGCKALSLLADALWYIDGNHDKINDIAKRYQLPPIPEM